MIPIESSLDVLYLALALSALILTIVLSVFIVRLTRTLKQINHIGDLVEALLGSFEKYIRLPARVLFSVTDKAKSVRKFFEDRNK